MRGNPWIHSWPSPLNVQPDARSAAAEEDTSCTENFPRNFLFLEGCCCCCCCCCCCFGLPGSPCGRELWQELAAAGDEKERRLLTCFFIFCFFIFCFFIFCFFVFRFVIFRLRLMTCAETFFVSLFFAELLRTGELFSSLLLWRWVWTRFFSLLLLLR